nr:MAG TPA: hypothetical protein [Bacteriophage sp.]
MIGFVISIISPSCFITSRSSVLAYYMISCHILIITDYLNCFLN